MTCRLGAPYLPPAIPPKTTLSMPVQTIIAHSIRPHCSAPPGLAFLKDDPGHKHTIDPMQQLLLKIEEACLQLNTATLAIPAAITILLGLFLWLGGTRYSFLVLALLGALLGAGGGLLIGPKLGAATLPSAAIGAIVLALVAGLLHKVTIVLLAMLIFALVGVTVHMGRIVGSEPGQETTPYSTDLIDSTTESLPDYAGQFADAADNAGAPGTNNDLGAPDNLQPTDAHSIALGKLSDAWQTIKSSAQAHRGALVIWAVAGAVVGMVLAWLLRVLIMAFCCSMVGSAAVIAGIITLLLAKGTPAISALQPHPRVIPAIFTGMLLFGWLTQLLLIGPTKDKDSPQRQPRITTDKETQR